MRKSISIFFLLFPLSFFVTPLSAALFGGKMKLFSISNDLKVIHNTFEVAKIIDGRTLELKDKRLIRLLGVKPVDDDKAKTNLESLIQNNKIIIVLDATHAPIDYKDKSGAYLAYVYSWGPSLDKVISKFGRTNLVIDGFSNVKDSPLGNSKGVGIFLNSTLLKLGGVERDSEFGFNKDVF